MTTHELKCWPEPFTAVLEGRKTHEIRVADRPLAVGDVLHLREWVPSPPTNDGLARYTGRECRVEVTHLTPVGAWGLPPNLCVMSIRMIAPQCSCTWEVGDSRCAKHPTCGGCGDPVPDVTKLCALCQAQDDAPGVPA